MTYSVTLKDFSSAPPDAIHAAEARFRSALEKALGDQVEPALRAFQNAGESSGNELSKDEVALAGAWQKAYEAAKLAGFRDLGESQEAYFEVRLR